MPLVDTGLIVRYYCDEAASGTTPTQLLDASGVGSDFDLDINYGSSTASFTETSGNRGWEGTSTTGTHRATKAISNTSDKVRDAIHGSETATIEIVGALHGASSNWGYVSGISPSAADGDLVIYSTAAGSCYVGFNAANVATFAWDFSTDRYVWHIVIDTTKATANDRVTIYRNGSAFEHTDLAPPAQNATIALSSGSYVTAWNRPDGENPCDGVLYYTAIYSSALSASDVSTNYAILSSDDDAPAASVTPELEEPGAGATVIAGIVPTAAQYLFQHATPIADVADGGWVTYYTNGTPGNNVDLFQDINDGNGPDDTNMIRSGLTPANDTMVTQLSPIVTPEAGAVTIKVRTRYC